MTSPKLWMLYIEGPDDVIASPSLQEAVCVAAAFNAFFDAHTAKRRAEIAERGGDPDNYPSIRAVVMEWDGTPEEHTQSVERNWKEYEAYRTAQGAHHG